jgi:hypothetical protein
MKSLRDLYLSRIHVQGIYYEIKTKPRSGSINNRDLFKIGMNRGAVLSIIGFMSQNENEPWSGSINNRVYVSKSE